MANGVQRKREEFLSIVGERIVRRVIVVEEFRRVKSDARTTLRDKEDGEIRDTNEIEYGEENKQVIRMF